MLYLCTVVLLCFLLLYVCIVVFLYFVKLYFCTVVLLYCIFVLLYSFIVVFLYYCIVVLQYTVQRTSNYRNFSAPYSIHVINLMITVQVTNKPLPQSVHKVPYLATNNALLACTETDPPQTSLNVSFLYHRHFLLSLKMSFKILWNSKDSCILDQTLHYSSPVENRRRDTANTLTSM